MRIVMAGSSGFLGGWLARRLRAAGHDVTRLVRRPPRGDGEDREVSWDPGAGRLDPSVLAGAGAVVNLAGAGVGDHRWTAAYKATLRSSRVDPTATLARTIAALPAGDRPGVLLNSSGISCYGDTRGRTVTEAAPLGQGLLPDVCREWEAATGPAAQAGVRVVSLRTAPVLHRDGGLLKPQLLPYRLGVAGRFGDGRQWTPWIALADWLEAAVFLLEGDLSGPVNVVSP
ncbi:MAG TPA: NAD-dependent epimerase/dehydratase family protein, partial [Micromonosporaceae bacterium]|nr:NAD-dependent epimerase/dehydratase family protein [Micromonosporaceae bacterium]